MAGVNASWQRVHLLARLAAGSAVAIWAMPRWGVVAGLGLAALVLGLQQLGLLPIFLCLRWLGPVTAAPALSVRQALCAWWHEAAALERVFSWQQPFAEHREPDHLPAGSPLRGVLLLHGFSCNRGLWNPWLRQLRALNRPHIALSLEPAFGSIDAYAPAIDAALRQLAACTGQAPIILAHSMGGLAARAWWRHAGHDPGRVHRIITLGSPHAGTLMARLSRASNARQMRRHSAWLAALAEAEPASAYGRFDCFYSHADQIVCPAGTALLPGARAHHIEACGHLKLVFDTRVRAEVLGLLQKETP